MDSIIISLIPTAFLLLLGAVMWYTDPWVRAQRALARSSQCVGCGAAHRNINACDGSFSAFCTEACHSATMEEFYPLEG
jgi:hypothetical protein